jgi:hypothetical protein
MHEAQRRAYVEVVIGRNAVFLSVGFERGF